MLGELGIERPLLVASPRWHDTVVLPAAGRWSEIPSDRIEVPAAADAVLAVGGGSAIDTAKAASAVSGLPLVSVPTTYSGAEWTDSYGVRAPDRRIVGRGTGARRAAVVYEARLTLDLPRAETVGTALNALAHCAEALYGRRSARSDSCALAGAELIAERLPDVVGEPRDVGARKALLRGAAAAGEALGLAGLALAHAIAQALGGRFGLPHGAMNALALPPALRFNAEAAPEAVGRFGARDRSRRRAGRQGRGAGATRGVRRAERVRDPGRRPARGRRARRGASGEPRESEARDGGRDRGDAALDPLSPDPGGNWGRRQGKPRYPDPSPAATIEPIDSPGRVGRPLTRGRFSENGSQSGLPGRPLEREPLEDRRDRLARLLRRLDRRRVVRRHPLALGRRFGLG